MEWAQFWEYMAKVSSLIMEWVEGQFVGGCRGTGRGEYFRGWWEVAERIFGMHGRIDGINWNSKLRINRWGSGFAFVEVAWMGKEGMKLRV